MKLYLQNIIKQLKKFSTTLEKVSAFIDKPWALIDEEFEVQKMIFKKDKQLILSKNGKVQIGAWDYFPEAKSILIDRNIDKILCNEVFIDNGIMILKQDGTENKFFVFVNENVVPDLDVNKYLKELRRQKLGIVETRLADGRVIEIQRQETQTQLVTTGNRVFIESQDIEDGKYLLAYNRKLIEVKDGEITKILTEKRYITPDGFEFCLYQHYPDFIMAGDYISSSNISIDNGKINFSDSHDLIVSDGRVVRVESKNPLIKFFNKLL